MRRQRRIDLLRSRIKKLGIRLKVRDDMPEEVAASFLAEMKVCPDCAAAAANAWMPKPDA